jgi:hypothetical protein
MCCGNTSATMLAASDHLSPPFLSASFIADALALPKVPTASFMPLRSA